MLPVYQWHTEVISIDSSLIVMFEERMESYDHEKYFSRNGKM